VLGSKELDQVLDAVGELLEARGEQVGIVVVGGASLNLLGFLERTTSDVDVIARVRFPEEDEERVLVPPEPIPEPLVDAIRTVARDFDLPADWMNTVIGAQWEFGLPPGFADDLTWKQYGGLLVGLAGRRMLIALKLFAGVDQGPESVHVQDLIALAPDEDELAEAERWVQSQDASPEFKNMIQEVVAYVQSKRA
jgi:hypothetical protein